MTVAEKKYLRIDTSIDCDSAEYQTFMVYDGLFIAAYLSIPLVWFVLLYKERKSLNPPLGNQEAAHPEEALQAILSTRDSDPQLQPLRFLFAIYQPAHYFMECVEMYRRVLFVGLLPLLSAASDRRAALGVFFSLCSLAFYREVEPFLRPSTNILAHVAQYANLLTYAAALTMVVGLDNGVKPLLFGLILVAVNCSVVGLILWACVRKMLSEREAQKWRRALTTEELFTLNAVMGSDETPQDLTGNQGVELVEHGRMDPKGSDLESRSVRALNKTLIDSQDLKIMKRVGAGAFGEVIPNQLKRAISFHNGHIRYSWFLFTRNHPMKVQCVCFCLLGLQRIVERAACCSENHADSYRIQCEKFSK